MTRRMTATFATIGLAMITAGCGGADTSNVTDPPARESAAPPKAARTGPIAAPEPLPLAAPSTRADGAAAFVAGSAGWMPILYLCDGVDGSRIAAVSPSRLTTFEKPGLAETGQTITLGSEDAGAGSVWRDLTSGGAVVGAVRSINPAMLGLPEATTLPTVSSVRIGTRETRCRWLPAARLLIVTANRSALVTRETDGSYTYRSFDFARPGRVVEGGERGTSSTPTTEVRGGRLVASPAGRETYAFDAPPWTYRVTASARTAAPGAAITVLKNGRATTRADAIAYEMAAARITD